MSFRYAPAVCVLLALALVPTLLHSYSTPVVNDRLTAAGVNEVLAGYASVPSDRNATWGKRRFDSDDWVERTYVSGETTERLRLTVVRTFDAKSVYHHPELAIADASFRAAEVKRYAERADVPVHVLRTGSSGNALGLYVLHYGSDYVEDPIWFQVRTAGAMLVSRRKPMTLFFVYSSNARQRTEEEAARLLFAAIDSFVKQRVE
jgi:hypothetical protein